ncbi:MAG: hypothetical protein LBR47_03640 [Spirochaetaceae bacterium]|jgi:two-component system sensor histidine kinase ChvG|nr:hypothetical protein [Spirochaetaceae bacterium]
MKVKPLLRGPIALRLFLFNSLLIFVPVAGFLSFEAYEKALLDNLEHALVQEGRSLAAWLGEAPVDRERAQRIIASLEQKHTSRIRALSKEGVLLADSSAIYPISPVTTYHEEKSSRSITSSAADPPETAGEGSDQRKPPQDTFLYRILSIPVRVYRKYILPPQPPIQGADYYSGKKQFDGEEIQAALSGRYGSTTRVSIGGQTSITLYSALPVFSGGEVQGAVLVSQSTYRILNDLYGLRLGVGRVFLFSLFIAIAVSLILALTISRPLSRLKNEAKQFGITGRTKRNTGTEKKLTPAEYSRKRFSGSGRRDEIDTLADAFGDLVGRLEQRIDWAERFSADAAHELKNPLAGIRASAELLETEEPVQKGLIASIENACGRMEKTINGLRALTLLERSAGTTPAEQFGMVISEEAQRYGSPPVIFENPAASSSRYSCMEVSVQIQNLETAVRNLFENAHSFSPHDKPVRAELRINGAYLELQVRDSGPGIPEELREKIFERFYTNRRGGRSGEHSGLGLAIVCSIAESGGGTVSVKHTADETGACFILSLPYNIMKQWQN